MHTIPLIDYQKIADAKNFYEKSGFTEIAVPWLLNYEAYSATRPPDRKEFYSLHGYLNASGEQSFIHLLLEGRNLEKHCCITACFRDEPVLDDIHHRYFVKVELIDTRVSKENLSKMIEGALTFMNQFVTRPFTVIQTDTKGEMFDIVDTVCGIEVGSYGIRKYKNWEWLYGTGIALPRFDTVINNINRHVHNNTRR